MPHHWFCSCSRCGQRPACVRVRMVPCRNTAVAATVYRLICITHQLCAHWACSTAACCSSSSSGNHLHNILLRAVPTLLRRLTAVVLSVPHIQPAVPRVAASYNRCHALLVSCCDRPGDAPLLARFAAQPH